MQTNIAKLRLEKNLSQLGLSKKIGASQKIVSDWEKETSAPGAGYLIKLANFFEVSIDYILKQ